jgi:hypothetical protein
MEVCLAEALNMMKMKSNNFPKQFPYSVSHKLEHKLQRLLATLDKRDVWILVDGIEGSGKTNTACYLLYWFHCMTGREFTLEHFYFDSDAMFEWVKSNSNGLINWDEASLGGLSAEWWSRSQINILKFAMTGRLKHHVFVLCIPRFNKLKEDLRRDRIHCMLHMDLGKSGTKYGNCMYLTKRGIEHLNDIYNKTKKRSYRSCMKKYGGFYCYIPYVFRKLLDEQAYELKKNEAIANIGKKKFSPEKDELRALKKKIGLLKPPINTLEELSKKLNIYRTTLYDWAKLETPPVL